MNCPMDAIKVKMDGRNNDGLDPLWTQARSPENLVRYVLYQLNYLVPAIKPVWPSHSNPTNDLSPKKQPRFFPQTGVYLSVPGVSHSIKCVGNGEVITYHFKVYLCTWLELCTCCKATNWITVWVMILTSLK